MSQRDSHEPWSLFPGPRSLLSHVFLLSPAHCGGKRARMLLRPDAASEMARRLRAGELTLGEAFAFMSRLYFRGKLAYARAVVARRGAAAAALVITPTRGLVSPNATASVALLEEFAATDIAAGEARYRAPLERDLAALAVRLTRDAQVVLLGSIASDKYVEALVPALGDRLHYPPAFVGRGDMSRGGLLLRSAAAAIELDYVPLSAASPRRGTRPPTLGPARHAARRPAVMPPATDPLSVPRATATRRSGTGPAAAAADTAPPSPGPAGPRRRRS